MQRLNATFALLALAITSVFFLPSIAGSHQIKGEVLDKSNNPIEGVLVRIYRGHKKINECRTKRDGIYSISFDSGSPISTIRYDHTDRNPATISDVSGARDHNIFKVMHKVGSRLSFDEALDSLSALERIYYLDVANYVPVASIRGRYGAVINRMHIPDALQQKLKQIRGLYRLRNHIR